LSRLEHEFITTLPRDGDLPPRAIVVLGAYGFPDQGLPLSSWPNDAGLVRIVEAVHLAQRCADCRIVVTGTSPTVEAMAEVMTSLGVSSRAIELDTSAESTAASARNLSTRLRSSPFYLVTSAGHMPRAMLAFRAMGLQPLPIPTDFRAPRGFASSGLLPAPRYLVLSDLAVHEYLGILWYRLQGM
jgi:uncharacterized SAM-binding protein YcdF (DUF218 family)